MTASPNFAEHRTDQTAWRVAAPQQRQNQRRWLRQVRGHDPDGHLYELPALILLLDRLPTPVLATGLDGVLVYTNPAFATMLGHPGTTTLTEQPLPTLLAGHSATPPRDCVTALRAGDTVVIDWLHAEGSPVRTLVSEALLETDRILLFSITDMTELMWNTPPEPRELGCHGRVGGEGVRCRL
jgi:PAS domain-containing protein